MTQEAVVAAIKLNEEMETLALLMGIVKEVPKKENTA